MSATANAKALPLFYRQIRMLNTAHDQDLCLMPPSDYRYAADTNAIPLVAEEFIPAQAHYPIVFSGTETPLPVAIVGLRNNENLSSAPTAPGVPTATCRSMSAGTPSSLSKATRRACISVSTPPRRASATTAASACSKTTSPAR
jgi:hypothetical protein